MFCQLWLCCNERLLWKCWDWWMIPVKCIYRPSQMLSGLPKPTSGVGNDRGLAGGRDIRDRRRQCCRHWGRTGEPDKQVVLVVGECPINKPRWICQLDLAFAYWGLFWDSILETKKLCVRLVNNRIDRVLDLLIQSKQSYSNPRTIEVINRTGKTD